MTQTPEGDPAVELLREGRPRTAIPLTRRKLAAEALVGGAFLATSVAMAVGLDADRGFQLGPTLVLVLLFAVAIRVQFDVGAGYTVPTQLVFVPMLLLLPTPAVPLLVAAGWFLGELPDVVRGRMHPSRTLNVLGNSWFAVGPALVLVAGDAQTPEWGDWPIYLCALVAQFAGDVASAELREWMGRGIKPSLQLRLVGLVVAIDALLSPLGLLAAFASEQVKYAFLLLVPPAGLLIAYANERAGRLEKALELSEAARAREALIAGASHEILTPVAILGGLVSRLGSDLELEPERRRLAHAAMQREVARLRHLVRQFVDYTRLKTDRELVIRPQAVNVAPALSEVADAFAPHADIRVQATGDLPPVMADPERLQQMVMILVSNAVKFSPTGSPIEVAASANGASIVVTVSNGGAGIPAEDLPRLFDERGVEGSTEGAGIGLYLLRELAERQGGTITVASTVGGTTFTITLPAA